MKPLVSVIMSVYNNAADVGRALDSLLAQTYSNLEIIAVNDGSTDGSAAVLEAYAARDPRVRVIHQENAGLGPAMNRAMREARGVYLARHDADDASAPTRIERQVEYLEAHPDVVLCGTWVRFVDPEGRPVASMEVPDDEALMRGMLEQGSNPLMHGSVMIRPAALEREGGGGYRFTKDCEDYDLWLRLSEHGRVGTVPSHEYLYTTGALGSVSLRYALARAPMTALCLRLHRERQAGGERTDWRAAAEAIYADAALPPAVSEAASAYYRGLEALSWSRWGEAARALGRAARGQGSPALRARLLLAAFWAAPLLRLAYRRRIRNSVLRYIRPAWVAAGPRPS